MSRDIRPLELLTLTRWRWWRSESYTTYSNSNGGGCWARAINWGYVKGNLTRHMAWNLIQSYPTDGSGMNCARPFCVFGLCCPCLFPLSPEPLRDWCLSCRLLALFEYSNRAKRTF